MSGTTSFAWRQQQRRFASRHDLPDLRTDEERQRYRKLMFKVSQAKRQLKCISNWRRDVANDRFDPTLPALLRAQAE